MWIAFDIQVKLSKQLISIEFVQGSNGIFVKIKISRYEIQFADE